MRDVRPVQRCQRIGQPRASPIQHMVVGQHRAVDAGSLQAGDIARMHPVMHRLARPGVVAGGDGGFEVDDARPRRAAFQFRQGLAPRVFRPGGARNRSGLALGKAHVVECGMHIRFMQQRLAGMREDLIDAAAGHHVAAQEQGR
ncbi:hypothetical protein D3C72_1236900 [compost metagenome]